MFFRSRSKDAGESAKSGDGIRDSPDAAILDGTTGLYRGWYFERRVAEEVLRCARYGRPFALVVWEPRLLPGETLEDDVVARIGHVIKSSLRQTDLAAQMERTRFAALLVEAEEHTGRTVAYRLKSDLASRVRGSPGAWRAGMAIFPEDGVDVPSLFRVAGRRLSNDISTAA